MNFTSFPILFQDANVVVVDKPTGISVHNVQDPQNLLGVLQEQLGIAKLYPVHRLDKETSGIQVVALNENWASKLAKEFEKRTVKKIYVGLLRGELKQDKGSWNQPLTDKAEGRNSPAGHPKDRVPCETEFFVIKKSKYFTLCEFNLITGRQHQIRKHSALDKHALVGDPRYGDVKYNKKMEELYKTPRMFLHCSRVEIGGKVHECAPPESFNILG